jgi:hypothetical protein
MQKAAHPEPLRRSQSITPGKSASPHVSPLRPPLNPAFEYGGWKRLEEGGAEIQFVDTLAHHLLANPDNHEQVLEFAKDVSVPSSEKFFVITVQRLKDPEIDWFLVRAKSHSEAGAVAMEAAKAKGLDPMTSFSTHISLAWLPG